MRNCRNLPLLCRFRPVSVWPKGNRFVLYILLIMPEVTTTNELLNEIEDTVSELVNLFLTFGDNKINEVPHEGGWPAGQVLRHVTKSTRGIARAMQAPSKPAERDPGKMIGHLKTTFLDFGNKMQSPEFIIPEEEYYNPQSSISELQDSFTRLRVNAGKTDLSGLVEGLPLGDVTKLEMLHFVLYHTQRHLHQLTKISDALNK